jgi:hypothetical protein
MVVKRQSEPSSTIVPLVLSTFISCRANLKQGSFTFMGRMDYPSQHLYQHLYCFLFLRLYILLFRNKLFNDMQSDTGLEINPQQIFELAMRGRYGVANERIINSLKESIKKNDVFEKVKIDNANNFPKPNISKVVR